MRTRRLAAALGTAFAIGAVVAAIALGAHMVMASPRVDKEPAAPLDAKTPIAASAVGAEFDLDGCKAQAYVLVNNGQQVPGTLFARVKCEPASQTAALGGIPAADDDVIASGNSDAYLTRINQLDAQVAELEARQTRLLEALDKLTASPKEASAVAPAQPASSPAKGRKA